MHDEEDLLTCEDICDEWFQELPSDATDHLPDALLLKLGGETRDANGPSDRSIRAINYR
ncbi:MAG: hypothetical protein ACJ746_01865 [Bryobacteraceae bacterium]